VTGAMEKLKKGDIRFGEKISIKAKYAKYQILQIYTKAATPLFN
jgi:hypothetical protein